MKIIYTLLNFIVIFFSCHVENHLKESGIRLNAVLKGTFYYLEMDSLNDQCCDHVYLLVEVKLNNPTDSIIQFYTFNCSAAENIVSDSKELITCINTCKANSQIIIILKPKQEFSIPIILRTKKLIDNNIRIGFILLNPKSIKYDDVFLTLQDSKETLVNVVWGDSIKIDINLEHPYEIR